MIVFCSQNLPCTLGVETDSLCGARRHPAGRQQVLVCRSSRRAASETREGEGPCAICRTRARTAEPLRRQRSPRSAEDKVLRFAAYPSRRRVGRAAHVEQLASVSVILWSPTLMLFGSTSVPHDRTPAALPAFGLDLTPACLHPVRVRSALLGRRSIVFAHAVRLEPTHRTRIPALAS